MIGTKDNQLDTRSVPTLPSIAVTPFYAEFIDLCLANSFAVTIFPCSIQTHDQDQKLEKVRNFCLVRLAP